MMVTLLALAIELFIPAPQASRRVIAETNVRGSAKTPRDGPLDYFRVAADIELFAACLRAGRSTSGAVEILASSYAPGNHQTSYTAERLARAWQSAASLNALGATPATAWQELEKIPGLSDVAALIKLSSTSGASLAEGCHRIASSLHDDASDQATARAERAGVLISIPLALFFLPAFLVLGLAPVVISLGTQIMP